MFHPPRYSWLGTKHHAPAVSGVGRVVDHAKERWAGWTLSAQFSVVASFLLIALMLHVGAWTDGRIQRTVTLAAATASTKLLERAALPQLDELAATGQLSTDSVNELSHFVGDTVTKHHFFVLRLWRADGTLAFTSGSRSSPPAAEFTRAAAGELVAYFREDHDFDPHDGVAGDAPVFAVFAPLADRQDKRGRIIAEFYEDASVLERELIIARQHNWLMIAGLTLGLLALPFYLLHRGSRIIADQKNSLRERLDEQSRVLQQNESLRLKLARSHQSSHLVIHKLMGRVGADLHDGPAQLLSLVLLRLHELARPDRGEQDRLEALSSIRSAATEALKEIRDLSAGLSLPELDNLTTRESILRAVATHERRTTTVVAAQIEELPQASFALRICAFRCVQEALNNSYRHAGGVGQRVTARVDGQFLELSVRDSGPGFAVESVRDDGLGLLGLRHRVEAVGGRFAISSSQGEGTEVAVHLPIVPGISDEP
jgi:signal transduction histidine kinase